MGHENGPSSEGGIAHSRDRDRWADCDFHRHGHRQLPGDHVQRSVRMTFFHPTNVDERDETIHKAPMRKALPYVAATALAGLFWVLAWAIAPSQDVPAHLLSQADPSENYRPQGPRPTNGAAAAASAANPRSNELGPIRWDNTKSKYVAMFRGEERLLTLEPAIQEKVVSALEKGRPFFGSTVVMDAKNGKILALAEYSQREPERSGVALRPDAPAASIFKLVSAAALLEASVEPEHSVCVSGGKRRLSPKNLLDRRQDRCVRFGDVVPLSLNAAMAKLTDQKLPLGRLVSMAENLGFGRQLPMEVPMEPSTAHIPTDAFERANTAAGFGDVRMSSLHAAILTSLIANRGEWIPPRLFETPLFPSTAVETPAPRLAPSVADPLAQMMVETTTRGTAQRLFARVSRASPLRNMRVGAKTGSLLFYDEHVDHSWFVAFAPAKDPEFVVASVVVNDWQLWYTKAGPLAVDALETAFSTRRARQ